MPSDSGLVPLGPRLDPATASRLRRLCVPRSTAAMALFLIAERSVGLSRLDVGDVDEEGRSVCVDLHRFAAPDYARSLMMAQLVERREVPSPPGAHLSASVASTSSPLTWPSAWRSTIDIVVAQPLTPP